MRSFGYVGAGNGGSSSSASNLSPLAPPFTVDRFNSKPNEKPLSHVNEPPYALKNWSYPHSSPSRPDFVVDSVRTSPMPAEADYLLVGSESVNPQTSHCSPSNLGSEIGSTWSALNRESVNRNTINRKTVDWSLLNHESSLKWSDINPNPSGATDFFSYLSETKPSYPPYVDSEEARLRALNEPSCDLPSLGIGPFVDNRSSQVDYTETLSGMEYAPPWEGTWSGVLSEANRGKQVESDNKLASLRSDMAGSFPYTNYMNPVACAESLNKVHEDSALSLIGSYSDFIGRENRTEHQVTEQFDIKSLSMKNHSCTPVDFSSSASSRAYQAFHEANLQGASVEPLKEPWANKKPYTIYNKRSQMPYADKTHTSLATKASPSIVIKPPAVNTTVPGTGRYPSKKEGSSQITRNFHGTTDLYHGSKAESGFQLPDINIPDAENIETVTSEDSPCWQGAERASLVSPFANIDDETLLLPMKKLQKTDEMIFHETVINHPASSCPKVSSVELADKTMVNENACLEDNGLLGETKSVSDSKISHNRLASIEGNASQVGTSEQATHFIKNDFLSDQEDTSKPAEMNVQSLVKSIHNLSALLLVYCSNDANALKEKDHLALDHVISNIDTCLSRKIVQVTSKQDSVVSQLDASNEFASTDKSQATAEAGERFHGRVSSQHAPDERWDLNVIGKKFEKLKGFSLREDGDVSKEHNMVQAIKGILEGNLECEEEFQSETLMYKNLWLEAEAELCSVSYKARLERMKREMTKLKFVDTKGASENTVALEKLTSLPKVSREVNECAIPSTSIQESPVSSSNSSVEDVKTSVMARFNILKCRDEPIAAGREKWQEIKSLDVPVDPTLKISPKVKVGATFSSTSILDSPVSFSNSRVDNVESSVMARFNILKHRGEPITDSRKEEEEAKSFDFTVGPHLQHQNVVKDDSRGAEASWLQNVVVSGWDNCSYSSSDWEHVLKSKNEFD